VRLSLTLQERWYALSRPQQLALGGGTVLLLFYILSRKSVRSAVSAAISDAERAILKGIVKDGQEAYIDAAFNIGLREGVSPYLLMGTLLIESGFGRALTKGSAFGQTVFTGDFIPRRVTSPDKSGQLVNTSITNVLAKYPLPGVKRVYWERPKISNIPEFKGEMWVPAHDLRVAAAGGDLQKAYSRNGGVAGGVGWGFTPWQLDWGSFAPALTAGAAWDPEKATAEAVKLIKANIATMKKTTINGQPLSPKTLVEAVIASYNVGAGGVVRALKEGKPLTSVTAHSNYIDIVSSVANKVGKSIEIV
jgi:hypothetical protein